MKHRFEIRKSPKTPEGEGVKTGFATLLAMKLKSLRKSQYGVTVEVWGGCYFSGEQAVFKRLIFLTCVFALCSLAATLRGDDNAEDKDPNQQPKAWKVRGVSRIVNDLKWEVERLRKTDKDQAGKVANLLVNANKIMKGDVTPLASDSPSLHVVAFSTGKETPAKGKTRPQQVAEVNVSYKAQPIVLVLCGNEKIHWKVSLEKGVRLHRVVLGGLRSQTVEGVPKGTPIDLQFHKAPGNATISYAGSEQTGKGQRFARQLKAVYDLPIATFFGAPTWEGDPILVGPENESWRVSFTHFYLKPHHASAAASRRQAAQEQLNGLRVRAPYFPLKGTQPYKSALADFDCFGPIKGTIQPFEQDLLAVAPPTTKGEYFALRHGDLRKYNAKSGRFTPVYGRVLWHASMAIDKRRGDILLASAEREELVVYHLDEGKWSTPYPTVKADFRAMAYEPESDRIFGLNNSSRKSISKLTVVNASNGKVQSLELLPPIRLENLRTDREGVWSLAAAGSHLLLLERPQGDAIVDGKPAGGRMWVIDASTGAVLFETRQRIHEAIPLDTTTPIAELWEALRTTARPGLADRIMWRMSARQNETVAFLADKFSATPTADAARVEQLITDLDSADFETRSKATAALERLGGLVTQPLKEALNHKSLEVRDQAKRLLEKARLGVTSDPELRRELRAVHILGRIKTDESRAILKKLASEENDSLRTHIARITSRRSKPVPPLPPPTKKEEKQADEKQ